MKAAVWLLVVLVAVGVALYAGELRREQRMREAAADAFLQSMADSEAAAKKAEQLAKWKEDTKSQWLYLGRRFPEVCRGHDKELCIFVKAQYAACSDLQWYFQDAKTPPPQFKVGEDCSVSSEVNDYVVAIRSGKASVN